MVSPLVLCLLAGILHGGEPPDVYVCVALSLSCYHCSVTGIDCNTQEKMCDKNQDTCISTITEISTQGKTTPTKYIVRSCGTKDMCNTNYSISLNATTLHATIRCCDKDRCPTPGLDVPKAINQNDVECPTCHEANDKCKTTMKIKCTGEQKKCVTYTAKDTKTQTTYSIQGCASENVCAMKNVTTLPFDHILSTKFDCSSHAASQLPGLFFPVAVVIATLKLLS